MLSELVNVGFTNSLTNNFFLDLWAKSIECVMGERLELTVGHTREFFKESFTRSTFGSIYDFTLNHAPQPLVIEVQR